MTVIEVLDIIGTIAFAISGVLVAVKNKLDLFGIYVLAIMTACGGGIIRDIILGDGMPVFFTQTRYIVVITLTALLTSLAYSFFNQYFQKLLFMIQIFDAAGLGVFTVLAAYKAINMNVSLIGVLFISVLTGVGGGILRDTFVNEVPMVLKSEIYALASLFGAIAFYLAYGLINTTLEIYICIVIIFIVRTVAMYFKLNLPIVSIKNSENKSQMKG